MSQILLPENSVEIIRGSSKTLELTVTDEKEEAVNLTGATLVFTVKQTAYDPRPLIQKHSVNPTQVLITVPREGVAQIYLVPADTQNLAPQTYQFDVWVILTSGKRFCVVSPSLFVVQAGVTLLPL